MLNIDRYALFPLAVVILLSWGVLAFGSVNPWAYVPLFVMAGTVGIVGLLGPRESDGTHLRLAASFLALFLAGALQLVPLPAAARLAISPSSERFPGPQSPVPPAGRTPSPAEARAPALRPLSVDPGRTVVGLACIGGLAVFLIGAARRLETHDVIFIVRGLLVLGALLALIGLIQQSFYAGKIYGFWVPRFGGSAFGPFSNKHHFAGWMLMTISVGLGYFCSGVAAGMRRVKPILRERLLWFASRAASRLVLTGFALVLMALSLVFTMSRSGISSFSAVLVLFGWFAVRGPGVAPRRFVMAGYFVFVLAVAIGWVGVDAVGQRFAGASWGDVGGRMPAWQDATRVISDFPLVGTGINTYEVANRIYQTSGFTERFAQVHNDYLQIAAEGGLLTGVPIVITVFFFAREVRRRFRERSGDIQTYWLRAGAVTGMIAVACQEVVDFSLQKPGNAALFVVLAAIAIHRPHGSYRLMGRSGSSRVAQS